MSQIPACQRSHWVIIRSCYKSWCEWQSLSCDPFMNDWIKHNARYEESHHNILVIQKSLVIGLFCMYLESWALMTPIITGELCSLDQIIVNNSDSPPQKVVASSVHVSNKNTQGRSALKRNHSCKYIHKLLRLAWSLAMTHLQSGISFLNHTFLRMLTRCLHYSQLSPNQMPCIPQTPVPHCRAAVHARNPTTYAGPVIHLHSTRLIVTWFSLCMIPGVLKLRLKLRAQNWRQRHIIDTCAQ